MTLKTFATGITLTAATLLGVNAAQAEDVTYHGDSRAAAICQAIVEDDPVEVRKQLRKAARESRGVEFKAPTAESFQCNGKTLDAFADEAGSPDALAYLTGNANTRVAQQ